MPGEPAHGAQRAPVRRHLPRAGPRRCGGSYLQPPAMECLYAHNAHCFHKHRITRAKAGLCTAGPAHAIAVCWRQTITIECTSHVQ